MTFLFNPKNFLLLYLTKSQVWDIGLCFFTLIILLLVFLGLFLVNLSDKRQYKKMYNELLEQNNSEQNNKNLVSKNTAPKLVENIIPNFEKCAFTNPENILCNSLYVIEGEKQCFKCRTETKVIALATDKFIHQNHKIEACDKLYIIPNIKKIEDVELVEFLNSQFGYYNSYSKRAGKYSYANHCNRCGVLQGNYYLHDELTESPFYFDNNEPDDICKAAKLNLYKISLKTPVEVDGDFNHFYPDYSDLIKTYAEYKEIVF